jgi:hypothetical protein
LRGCIVLLGLAALFLLALATPLGLGLRPKPVHAAPNQGDEIVLGDDLTMHEGEHINGDLVMLGGDLTMRAGSRVEGSVTAFGGRVEIDGVIKGELVAFGGDITLGARARVKGEVIALGGQVHRAEGAQAGRIIEGAAILRGKFWRSLRFPFFSLGGGPGPWPTIWAIVATLVGALLITLLGVAIVTFWPTQTTQVGRTILIAPLPSLGVGCALYPLTISLVFLILISLCLAPFVPLVVLALVAASLFGWVSLGALWGRWLVWRAGGRRPAPVMAAGVGVFALSIVAAVVGAVPCLGLLLVLGMASIGLGAVALSRFGTSSFRGRPAAEPPS